jgi:hypothetical protein
MTTSLMKKDDRRQAEARGATWQGRALLLAVAALIFSLCLIAGRDGIDEVIPDLWASAGTIAHMLGTADWPFG